MAKKEVEEVIFQPQDSHDVYFTFCEPGMREKWKHDKTVPLVNVLELFQIYVRHGDVKQTYDKPSKGELETVFGTSRIEEVAQIMLEKGRGRYVNKVV